MTVLLKGRVRHRRRDMAGHVVIAAASLGCWLIALTAGRLMAYVSEFIS